MRVLVRVGVVAMIALSSFPARAAGAPLDSLVAAERAFAALSAAKGMKEAFLAFLAADAVVFQPHAVAGRKAWEERPASAATLNWEPSFVAVSSAGDMGYTTGPWEYRPAPDSAGTPAPPESYRYGQFNSVWTWEKHIGWRVLADIGVMHPKPSRGGFGSGEYTPGPTLKVRTMKSGKASMPDEDKRLSRAMRASGPREALASLAAADIRVNSEGRLPAIGLEAAQARFDSLGGFYAFKTEGSKVARSGDLGYSYGIAERFLAPDAAPADSAVFLHVWRQDDGRHWRLALAVINPLPGR